MSGGDRKSFRIGPATIEPGSPVYVIAELGVNHDGRASVARELIHAAADAEVDAVKFQVFSADRLVTRQAPMASYQRDAAAGESQHAMLCELELSHEEIADLATYAGYCGVEFLATPFSVPDLQFLVSIGVRALKIASSDIVNRPLLEAAAASQLPAIVSTGAADFEEIAAAAGVFQDPDTGPLALLHCVSSYPARETEANLRAIGTLAQAFGCPTGFSDHTDSLTIGGYAAAAGARIIEKHMTLDRTRPGPDHAFSLEPEMMREYIRHIRRTELLLGEGLIGTTPSQEEIRRLARGSVVATRDIEAGEVLRREMLTIKRPGGGIPPGHLDDLIGKLARSPIPADTAITWDVVSPATAGEPARDQGRQVARA